MKKALMMGCILWAVSVTAQTPNFPEKRATILLDNISLEEALTILSISYGIQFSYSDDVVPTQTIINLSIQDDNLSVALEKLLAPFGVTYKKANETRIVLRASLKTLVKSTTIN
jgi:TonB-dependent starch-binding outer membrane protein SusC